MDPPARKDPPDPKGRKGTPEMLGRKERLARLAQQGRPGWTGPPDPKARLELLEPLSQEIDRLFAISGQVANDRHRAPSHEPTRVGG